MTEPQIVPPLQVHQPDKSPPQTEAPVAAVGRSARHYMDRANAYAALTKELEHWRLRPAAELAPCIGTPPVVSEVRVAGELVSIEVSVNWADTSHENLRIEAVANGPSHWTTERLVERITVSVQSNEVTI